MILAAQEGHQRLAGVFHGVMEVHDLESASFLRERFT
jgi:hypothetical protein